MSALLWTVVFPDFAEAWEVGAPIESQGPEVPYHMVLGSGWLAGEMKDWEAVSDEGVRKAPPGRFHRHRDDYDDEMVWLRDEAGGRDRIRLRSQRGGVGQNCDHGRRGG